MKIYFKFSLFLLFLTLNLYAKKQLIEEKKLLKSYFPYNFEIKKNPPYQKKYQYYVQFYLGGLYESNINYLYEINDWINVAPNNYKKGVGISGNLEIFYHHLDDKWIFNLINTAKLYNYQKYSEKNKWINKFTANIGIKQKKWRFLIKPGYEYEDFHNIKLFSNSYYSIINEFKHLGIEYKKQNRDFKGFSDRDESIKSFKYYFYAYTPKINLKLGYKYEKSNARMDYYSYDSDIPFFDLKWNKSNFHMTLSYLYKNQNYLLKLPDKNKNREDNVKEIRINISKFILNKKIFFNYLRLDCNSSLIDYNFNFHSIEYGIQLKF